MKDKEMETCSLKDCEPVTVMLEVNPEGRVLFDIDGSCWSDAGQDTYILMCLFGKLLQRTPYTKNLGCTFDFSSACALPK